ncbi:MAG: hypothetical protein O3A20_00010 [Planctomycetota bacterium]|nr:hypothetical protein [Planctomycetota bacterium]
MRRFLPLLAVALTAAPALAQSVNSDMVTYNGTPGAVPADFGINRLFDADGDGVFATTALERISFGFDAQSLVNFVEDMVFHVDPGNKRAVYAVATDNVIRLEDLNGDGDCNDAGEITVWVDTRAAFGVGNTSPDSLDFVPGTHVMYVSDDIWTGAPTFPSGIHRYEDLNLDGDAQDAGESSLWVDGTLTQTLAESGGPVVIGMTDFEALMVSSSGVVIGFEQQMRALIAFKDLNTDGDAMDAGEAWNFCNLVKNTAVNGLDVNADVLSGALLEGGCVSSSGPGIYTSLEILDVGYGEGPGGRDAFYMATTVSPITCAPAAALVYRGVDLNDDGDINDAGEVTLYYDGPNSPHLYNPNSVWGGTANDGGFSAWHNAGPPGTTAFIRDTIEFLKDANNDGDAMDVGESLILHSWDPDGTFAVCLTDMPAGAFFEPPPTPPFFIEFGTGAFGTNAMRAEIGNAGTPVIGQSFSVTLEDARANTTAVLMMGFSRTQWGNRALPFDLGAFGATGSFLYQSRNYIFPTFTNTLGEASFSINVPSNPNFVGRDLYFQWQVIDPGANPLGVITSNAGWTQVE